MAKNPTEKIKFFPIEGMRRIAQKYYGVFVKRVTIEGKDYQGNQLPPYKPSYKKMLEKDFRKKSGGRIKGYEGVSLTTGDAKIARRPLKLRGLTMGPGLFKIGAVTNSAIEFEWSGEAGMIIEAQAEKGRNVIDGMPAKESAMIEKWIGDLYDEQEKKIPNVTVIRGKR